MKEYLSFATTLMKGENLSERLVVHINNTYGDDYKLVSTAQIKDDNATVSEWTTDDPIGLLNQGIEAAEPEIFEQTRMKQAMLKAGKLFEATKVQIIPKGKDYENY